MDIGRMNIYQGDIYWLHDTRTKAAYPHPCVVLQADVLNHSRITTVVVCVLTSNQKRLTEPGNVLLDPGEANLPRQSVVVVSQVETVEKTQLGAYIGSLSQQRIEQILAGMRFQQLSFFARYETEGR
jgi:mRNA interferase MazF